jgi:hypothetical protein
MSETGISVVPFQESQLQSLLKMSVFRQGRGFIRAANARE